MRRIQPPQCTVCKSGRAEFESDVWPTLLTCNSCRKDAAEFIARTGYHHGNPLLLELIRGVDNGIRDDSIRMWRERPGQSSTYYEFWVQKESDSQIKFENPLDILDTL